jgi:hypothetical protein
MDSFVPKSILKNSVATGPSKAERDRETALYHAYLIQNRKDIELEILISTETLIDLPTPNASTSVSSPSSSDVHTFKTLLQPFQPSDYDTLILERNINHKCGYVLCPEPNRTDDAKGGFRILGAGRGTNNQFKVVTKEELERWCSEECARRALYVRVQLSERPAWERGGSLKDVSPIELLDEPKRGVAESELVASLGGMGLDQEQEVKREQGVRDLALERGDSGRAAMSGRVNVTIQERQDTSAPKAPELENIEGRLDNMHLSIEGYTPSSYTGGSNRAMAGQEEESDEDMDWKI